MVGVAISGCSVVKAIHNAIKATESLKNLNSQLQKSETATFEVTYQTTGSSPSTIIVAQQPPHNYLTAVPASAGSGAFEYVANANGSYACSQSSTSTSGAGSTGGSGSSGTATTARAGAGWTCERFAAGQASTYNAIGQIYTGAYWYTILAAVSTAAAFVGDNVKSSTMSVNGFNLQCTSITAKNTGSTGSSSPQVGTWCTTSQGILGYVSASGSSSAFEIKSYTTTPSSSLFQLPAGAKVTNLAGATGSTGSTTST